MVRENLSNNLDYSLMNLDELLTSTGAWLVYESNSSKAFSSVVMDSRNVKNNSLFIPLRGENQDGHVYIEPALKNGAKFFVVDFDYLDENETALLSLCKKL